MGMTAKERDILHRFYRNLRRRTFIQASYLSALSPPARILDEGQLRHQQEIISKVVAERGPPSDSDWEQAMMRKRLGVLDQIADCWTETYGDLKELDEWLAGAVMLRTGVKDLVQLPGFAPISKPKFYEFSGVDGWLFHAPAGVPLACRDDGPVLAVVTWIGDPIIDGESLEELLNAVLERAVDGLAESGKTLRAALASPHLARQMINSAMRRVANEIWPEPDTRPNWPKS